MEDKEDGMKKFKRIISVIIAAALLGANVAAAEVTKINDKAEVLYRLGLIKGVSDTGFDPGLGMICTREQAIVAVLRVTGNLDNVFKENYNCSFADVSEWAKPYVAYGESIGLCYGIEDGYFGAAENVTLRQLCAMYLRMLGYKGNASSDIYEHALETAKPLGMCSADTDMNGSRSDLIDISYNSLYVSVYGGTTALVRYLADNGIMSVSDIAGYGDDGLISAYYSSEPAAGVVSDELRGDLEHAISYNFAEGSGTGMSIATDSEKTEYEGVTCEKITVGKNLSFKLDDGYITSDDKYFTLVVKYFDSGVDRIRIAYNVANMPYCSGYIAKTNTNVWKEARLVIKNAQFSHSQSDGADISIFAENESGAGVDEYISEVMLVKQSPDEQYVNPLEVEPIVTTAVISFDGMGQNVCLTQSTTGTATAYYYTKQTEQGGEGCISIGVGKRCILNLDDDFMDPDDHNCQINITYFDHGTDRIRYAYSTEENRYKDVYIQKTGTDTWITHTLNVTDASFMNRQDGGIDFSIWGLSAENSKTGDENEYISRVEIIKQ